MKNKFLGILTLTLVNSSFFYSSGFTQECINCSINPTTGKIENIDRQGEGSIYNPNAPTFLYYKSEPGDYIGAGNERFLVPKDGKFKITAQNNRITVNFEGGSDEYWSINFAAPENQKLKEGTYKDATRYPFQSPTKYGFDFSGSGRGCNKLNAEFTINQLVLNNQGNVKFFDATFEQHCEGEQPALTGRIKISS